MFFKTKKKTTSNGFTLVELLVVITIIGILSSIVLFSMQNIRGKARDARRVSDLRQIMMAMELYYDDRAQYVEKGTLGEIVSAPDKVPPFLDPAPIDPGNTPLACQPEGYRWWGNTSQPQQYCAWTCLESGAFFAASPKGTRNLDSPPTSLNCW